MSRRWDLLALQLSQARKKTGVFTLFSRSLASGRISDLPVLTPFLPGGPPGETGKKFLSSY